METKFCYSSSSCSLRVVARAFICFQFASKGCVDVFSANAPTWNMAQKAQPLSHCYEIVLHSIDTPIFSELSLPLLYRNSQTYLQLLTSLSSPLCCFFCVHWLDSSNAWQIFHIQMVIGYSWPAVVVSENRTCHYIGEHSTSSANCPTAAIERPP